MTLEDKIKLFSLLLNSFSKVQWRVTSWIRPTFSHRTGSAVDNAPTFVRNFKYYAVTRRKDPFLNLRKKLFRFLKAFSAYLNGLPFLSWSYLIFIESDHLHVQLLSKEGASRTVRWPYPKGNSVYYKSEDEWPIGMPLLSPNQIRRLRQ